MRKPARDIARDHRGAELVEHPGRGRAAEQHVAELIEIDAGGAPERERLADGLDVDAADELVAELDGLAGAGRARHG